MAVEIGFLNKTVVALATDSAMTDLGTGKIYPANKLFALTKWHPIGVMIYANVEFMGVPWETIIDQSILHAHQYPTTNDLEMMYHLRGCQEWDESPVPC